MRNMYNRRFVLNVIKRSFINIDEILHLGLIRCNTIIGNYLRKDKNFPQFMTSIC